MKKKTSSRQTIKRFFEPVRGNIWFLGRPLLRSVINSLLTIYAIYVFKQATAYMQNGDYDSLVMLIVVFTVVFILHTIFSYHVRHYGWASIDQEGLKFFHRDWITDFFLLDNIEVEKLGIGKLLGVMNTGFRTWTKMYQEITNHIPCMLIIGVYSFIQVWNIGGKFIFVLFFILVILWFYIIAVNAKAVSVRKEKTLLSMGYQRQFVKMLMSKMEIIYSDKVDEEIDSINHICSIMTAKNYKVADYLWKMFMPTRWISHGLKIGILLYGGRLIKNGVSDFSQFVGLVATVSVFQSQMDKFLDFYKMMTNDFVQVERLRNTFDEMKRMKDNGGEKFCYKKGAIEIKNLTFGYTSKTNVFDNFSLKVLGGKKIALIGTSGAGKTTLLKILTGYLDIQGGEVIIDNYNLAKINKKSYYKHIGYLTQEPNVFDGTIRENLLYGIQYAYNENDETFQKQLKKNIIDSRCEFIYDFKDGLDTEIGERGVRLSGGQKQRLAIAKIMLKSPNIILLDEPTSALDSVSEHKISEALHNLFKGKTVIIVAHRLQTVKEADEIIVLKEGIIVERGTHESLKRKKGLYREMLDLQTSF